ncbi:PREDICTED: germinal-center associated nuclear protein-like [Priapulus caudatus]|uniref:Germinal-center associated nuclear protein-like n=1 Tax=Priapulus caudatus TaxID=37621 RepID=A0ABM1EKQ0_PRICU|nr:PREDICTED: germinal-center associated nuclear protein-like [Priapulus caudatus]
MLTFRDFFFTFFEELAWKPLNIPHLIAPHLTKRRRAGCIYYWKVALLSHGAAGGGGRRAELARWVRARFTKGHVPSHLQQENVATLSLYSVDVEQMQAAIGVCVTAVDVDGDDPGDLAGSRRLLGTSGVLYSLCPPRNDEVIEEFWHDARAKLRLLLESKPCKPRVPLVVMLLDWPLVDGRVPTEDVEEGLRLPGATGNATTCAHHVFNVAGDVQQPVATDTMETAVSWLSAHAPSIPDLERRPLAEFVEEGLSRHFYQPVYENLAERRQAGLLQQVCVKQLPRYTETTRIRDYADNIDR